MKIPRVKNKRNVFVISFLTSIFFFFFFQLDVFRRIENVTYDWRIKTFSDKQPTGDIALIFIGDDSLQALGEWPISRQWYAGLAEILHNMGARAIVFDILFIDSSGPADREFAAAIKNAGNVILPFYFDHPEKKKGIFYSDKIVRPLKVFRDSLISTGFINIIPDSDGIIRKYPLFIEHNEKMSNSLCVSIIEDIFGGSIESMDEGSVEFITNGAVRKIPLAGDYSTYFNVYTDLTRFPNYSFVQVFQSYLNLSRGEKSIIPPDVFKDKVVLVGLTATGVSDKASVSGVPNYPLMGIHASFLENFFKGEFIRKVGNPQNILMSFFFSFTAGLAAVSFTPLAGIAFVVFLAGLSVVLAFVLFTFHLLWIDILPVVMSIVFAYGVLILAAFITEKKEGLKVRDMFGRYVSSAVMEKLLSSGGELLVEGEQKTLTVLFADIRGFTSFADRHTPEETFAFLNRILSIMTEAVFRFGGTLDKFIGDEVMAIYGAPVDDPEHALNAVLSAREMMRRMKNFSKDVKIGIGINTGTVIIGNIGTPRRMEYTAIGDAVNVAARIEGLTAGEEILVGYETYKIIEKEGLLCEHAGTFNIRGKGEGIDLYRVKWESSHT